MANMVKVIARTPGVVMLEGGRVGGYTPVDVSARWYALMGRRFGHILMTVDAYELHVCKLSETQLRAECTRRGIERSGSVHEMRAALLDGIAPYNPTEHASESPAASLAERIEAAEDKDALKALAEEAGASESVDFRYGAEKLRGALLEAIDEGEDVDKDEHRDSLDEFGEDH